MECDIVMINASIENRMTTTSKFGFYDVFAIKIQLL